MNCAVDIILPNFNKEKYLKETINSIINQSYNNWKLMIVDDCSTDNSKKILDEFSNNEQISIKYLNKNMGAAFARNLAIRQSNSKYVSFIDADDLWDKDKLKNQLNFMEKNDYKFTYTDYTPFIENGGSKKYKKRVISPDFLTFNKFILDTTIGTSTMMITRKLIEFIKFPKVQIQEDFSFKCKLLKKDKAYRLNQNNTFYRISKNSLNSNKLKNLYWLWYINKKLNNLNIFNNLKSLICISLNSLKKYGFK